MLSARVAACMLARRRRRGDERKCGRRPVPQCRRPYRRWPKPSRLSRLRARHSTGTHCSSFDRPRSIQQHGGAETNSTAPPSTPSGDGFMFQVAGSALPGMPGNGRLNEYSAKRSADGWTSTLSSPDGTQVDYPLIGGFSADHGYAAVAATRRGTDPRGSLDLDDPTPYFSRTGWIRYPDGSYHLTGEGLSLQAPTPTGTTTDSSTTSTRTLIGLLLARPTSSLIRTTRRGATRNSEQLTADAPPTGTPAVYDRTGDGLHLISLLPGDVTPTNPAFFEGSSIDGSTVLFSIGSDLYARVNNAKTLSLGTVTAAGVSADGSVVYYNDGGNISSIDTASEQVTPVVGSGDAQPILLGPDGDHFLLPLRATARWKQRQPWRPQPLRCERRRCSVHWRTVRVRRLPVGPTAIRFDRVVKKRECPPVASDNVAGWTPIWPLTPMPSANELLQLGAERGLPLRCLRAATSRACPAGRAEIRRAGDLACRLSHWGGGP